MHMKRMGDASNHPPLRFPISPSLHSNTFALFIVLRTAPRHFLIPNQSVRAPLFCSGRSFHRRPRHVALFRSFLARASSDAPDAAIAIAAPIPVGRSAPGLSRRRLRTRLMRPSRATEEACAQALPC
ncbi:hypothetical protein ACQJBY_053236 [Aegilops geniculata]